VLRGPRTAHISRKRRAGRRIRLVARHGGGPVVEDHNSGETLVIDDVDKARDSGVDKVESPITATIFLVLFSESLLHSKRCADTRAHADAGIHCGKGLQRRKGVTADIARDKYIQFRKRIKKSSVGHRRRVGRPHGTAQVRMAPVCFPRQ